MEINEAIAHIACACGAKFQVLNDQQEDWDEQATAAEYRQHLLTCPAQQPTNQEA